ncbi:MAG: hypothetical protein ACYTBJ_27415 [Planctomycetota bacterium]|jgi:hypothetical protein
MMANRLQELETIIEQANSVKYLALREIKDKDLWADDYKSWPVYLRAKQNMSESSYGQLRSNYNALQELDIDANYPFKNESAIRTIRQHVADVRQEVYNRAVMLARDDGDTFVSSTHIKAVTDTVIDILRSGGYADDGDGGMMAATAQVNVAYEEYIKRQRAHRRNGSKLEWQPAIEWMPGQPLPRFEDVQSGQKIVIRWAIVEVENE